MEKLHYTCGRKVNLPFTYLNNIYGTFWNKIHTTKPPVLISISPSKYLNVKFYDVMHVNDIIKYNQSHGVNGEQKNNPGNYHIFRKGYHFFYKKRYS